MRLQRGLMDDQISLDHRRPSRSLRFSVLPFQRSHNSLEMPVTLELHNPGRQRPTLGGLDARVTQPGRLAINRVIVNAGDQTHRVVGEIRRFVRDILCAL